MHTSTVILSLAAVCLGAKLPPTFKRCKKDSSDADRCLSAAVEDALRRLTAPFDDVGLPSLDPLDVPALTIGAGTGPVGVEQKFKDLKLYGFTKPGSIKFGLDLEKKTASLDFDFPEIKIQAEYDVNGKILLLPVYGKGPATINLEHVSGTVTFHFEEYEKKGKKFLKVAASELTLNPKLVRFNFENLFDGDKALGDNINKVLNENWEEVFKDIQTNYEEAFNQIAARVFNNLLAKVPISELFAE